MKRILVIDDDEQVCGMLAMMLEANAYEVTSARDGDAGLRLYREQPFNVVITDIFMPGKEGLETIRELLRFAPDARVIAISGGTPKTPMDFLPLARRFGARATLYKPIYQQQLLDAVSEVLQDVSK